MVHILWYIIVGFLAGFLARAIMPGANPMGILATTLLGILGSLVGGVIASFIWKPKDGSKFHPAGIVFSVLGALVILYIRQRFL